MVIHHHDVAAFKRARGFDIVNVFLGEEVLYDGNDFLNFSTPRARAWVCDYCAAWREYSRILYKT
jgi:hypothetical protein